MEPSARLMVDETLCLFAGQRIDDELYVLFTQPRRAPSRVGGAVPQLRLPAPPLPVRSFFSADRSAGFF